MKTINYIWTIGSLLFASCGDFLRIDPPKTEVVAETVFTDDVTAVSALRGIYSLMMTNPSFTNGEIDRFAGLSADEFSNYKNENEQQQFFFPSLLATNNVVYSVFWKEAYLYISNANALLEGIQSAAAISEDAKGKLEGEAKFIRAFCHFYLVNLFGDVPYVTSTDYRINSALARIPKEQVYGHIINDLLDAQRLLADDFSFANNQRSQPNRGAATALLARVYLYTGAWANAESQATSLITNSNVYSLGSDLNTIFLANSSEAIWQLQPVRPEQVTMQGQLFILATPPASSFGGVSLRDGLLTSFETGDDRRTAWVGTYLDGDQAYYYPNKYKYRAYATTNLTEYAMVLRLAEQYLIRAEARVQQDKLALAIADVDAIRNRAGLPLIGNTNPSIGKSDLLLAIEQERRIEFFAEWGHRWLDLKRTDRANAVLSSIKTDWQETDVLYPIPLSEILVNPNLTQNLGY